MSSSQVKVQKKQGYYSDFIIALSTLFLHFLLEKRQNKSWRSLFLFKRRRRATHADNMYVSVCILLHMFTQIHIFFCWADLWPVKCFYVGCEHWTICHGACLHVAKNVMYVWVYSSSVLVDSTVSVISTHSHMHTHNILKYR